MSEPNLSIEQEMRVAARRICRGIHAKKARRDAEQEYLEHMEDHYYSLLLGGYSQEKALQAAIEAIGQPDELCHMLASVHNRLPVDFGKRLLVLCVRALIAAFVGAVLWGWGLLDSHPITYLIPAFIFAGLAPLRYARAICLRIKAVHRIKRTCQQNGLHIKRQASPILSVFLPARQPEWVITSKKITYCVHFLACPHRSATLHFLDSYAYTLTLTHGQGARFADRSPFRNNIIKAPDQTYNEQSYRHLFFPIGPEYASDTFKRILLINPVPSLISYQSGTTVEYAGNKDTIFGFTICDTAHFAKLLSQGKESL